MKKTTGIKDIAAEAKALTEAQSKTEALATQIASMTYAEVDALIDAEFSKLTAKQRAILKAMGKISLVYVKERWGA